MKHVIITGVEEHVTSCNNCGGRFKHGDTVWYWQDDDSTWTFCTRNCAGDYFLEKETVRECPGYKWCEIK